MQKHEDISASQCEFKVYSKIITVSLQCALLTDLYIIFFFKKTAIVKEEIMSLYCKSELVIVGFVEVPYRFLLPQQPKSAEIFKYIQINPKASKRSNNLPK